MNGKFITVADMQRDAQAWGESGWLSGPLVTNASDITMMEVTFNPGGYHDFHRHPRQEEVLYVMSGQVEQWLEQEHRTMGSGDSVFVGRGVVHATFNEGDAPAKLVVVLGPCDGESGYSVEEMADQAPWNSLR